MYVNIQGGPKNKPLNQLVNVVLQSVNEAMFKVFHQFPRIIKAWEHHKLVLNIRRMKQYATSSNTVLWVNVYTACDVSNIINEDLKTENVS